MKVNVTKVDVSVEGEAGEIAEAMPSILGNVAQPTPVSGGGPELAAPEAAPLELEAGDEYGDDIDGDQLIRTAADVQPDLDETMPHVPDAPVPADGYVPEEDWQQVPTSRRVWGPNSGLHVATEPGGLDLFCEHVVGGLRRPRDWRPVPFRTAKVCGKCNVQIRIKSRPS